MWIGRLLLSSQGKADSTLDLADEIRELPIAELESVSGGYRLCGDIHYDVVE